MFQNTLWQRFRRGPEAKPLVARCDARPRARALDLAALEPRLLFSAAPIPIDGDVVLESGGPEAGVVPITLPPVESAELPRDATPTVSEAEVQIASLDTNELLRVEEGNVVTVDASQSSAEGDEVSADDAQDTTDGLTYTITGSSANGTFRVAGTPSTTFTQQDIDLGRVTYQQSGSEATVDYVEFELRSVQGDVSSGSLAIDLAAINSAPVLSDANVALDPVDEDAGVPVGAVGTLISDLVDLDPASKSVERTDVVPFYSAGSGNNSQRSISWWWDGWDEWATRAEISLEKHGAFWTHLPYGRILPGPMDFAGKSDAAAGVPGSHGPLPHIAEGLEHYFEQIVTPDDELIFYFGAPDLIYTPGMTYADYELAVLNELSDVLGLADDAKVSIGFDATYGQPTSFGGVWTVLGGPTGYNAQVLQKVASFGVNIILEPWIIQGATWAYDYDTIYTETFYRDQELDAGAIPRAGFLWASSEELTGEHYRLPTQIDVDSYYGGDWEHAISQILSVDDIPLGRLHDATSLFEPAWVEFAGEVTDPSTLIPYPGYDPPGSTRLNEFELVNDADVATLFSHVSETIDSSGATAGFDRPLAPVAVLDNVLDTDGLVTGLAITGADTTNGTWWYSTDGGQSWDGLGTVSAASARVLAANSLTRIYFQPDADYVAAPTNGFTFQAWDRSDSIENGTAGVDASSGGGTSAFSAESDFASVSVTSVNDAPTINPIANQMTNEDSVLGPIAVAVGDVDTPVANLIVTATSSDPTIIPHENISISGSGANRSLTITPAINQFGGPVRIAVTVSDGALQTTEEFDVVINPQPDAPVAADDQFIVTEGQTLNVSAPGLLGNDSDADGDALTAAVVSGPTHGTLLPLADGSFQYTPAAEFVGDDSFQYVAQDGMGASNVATVRITVRPDVVPLPPDRPDEDSPVDDRLSSSLPAQDPPLQDPPSTIKTPATQFPQIVLPSRHRSAGIIDAQPTDPQIPVPLASASDPNITEEPAPFPEQVVPQLAVPTLSAAVGSLPAGDDALPAESAIEVADAEAPPVPSPVAAEARVAWQHELDQLQQQVAHAESVEELADGVAIGLGSALTACYLVSQNREESTLAKILTKDLLR